MTKELNNKLIEAVYSNNLAEVKEALKAGADVHASDDLALRWASYYGRTEVVKLLIKAGADVHARDDLVLRWASRYGHTEVVKLLIEAGADMHVKGRWDGLSALEIAEKRYPELAKLMKAYDTPLGKVLFRKI